MSVAVCRLWRYILWLNGASYSKSYYWQPIGSRIWEIDWYQNEWPWPSLFRGRLRSCQPLRHIRHWISRKLLEIEPWFQRTTNRKWDMGYRKRDRSRHMTLKSQTRNPNTLRAQYLENSWRCYLATIANYWIVCCEAVRSAILATAWLLVTIFFSPFMLMTILVMTTCAATIYRLQPLCLTVLRLTKQWFCKRCTEL